MVIEIPEGKGRPVSEIQSAKLSSELGLISRRFIPIPTKWRNLTDADKMQAMDRLKTRFEIDLEDEYTESSVMSILSKLSRHQRHKLHLYYKKFPSDEEARQNLPIGFNLTQNDWEEFCNLFSDPAYQAKCEKAKMSRQQVKFPHNQGSRAFVTSRYAKRTNDQEPNRMEWFKLSHSSEAKGWKTHWAQEAYVEMERLLSTPVEEGQEARTIDSIVDQVLGTRAGYIKGLGYGPKPMKKTKTSNATDSDLSRELAETRTNFEKLREQMHVMAQAMVAAGIQVPMSEFDGKQSFHRLWKTSKSWILLRLLSRQFGYDTWQTWNDLIDRQQASPSVDGYDFGPDFCSDFYHEELKKVISQAWEEQQIEEAKESLNKEPIPPKAHVPIVPIPSTSRAKSCAMMKSIPSPCPAPPSKRTLSTLREQTPKPPHMLGRFHGEKENFPAPRPWRFWDELSDHEQYYPAPSIDEISSSDDEDYYEEEINDMDNEKRRHYNASLGTISKNLDAVYTTIGSVKAQLNVLEKTLDDFFHRILVHQNTFII
ncbi:Transposase, Ptta/En/Spm, plant [Corchorus olitorius]|uniref:Transposase, Ptta/En/Spm, plant n=1 Tax=Corchorus olitorius TaxID=93759 RepID=A0A1R3JID9_9ROSI|nr:Transposase, Ptta/En/Spm, plant [Corchorus olitorius]